MKILAVTRRTPGTTFEAIQRLQRPEAAAAWGMMLEGFVREIYFDPDKPAVVLVLEADGIEDARARLASLPMVRAGLLDFDFTVLGPYRQLAVLFAGEGG